MTYAGGGATGAGGGGVWKRFGALAGVCGFCILDCVCMCVGCTVNEKKKNCGQNFFLCV